MPGRDSGGEQGTKTKQTRAITYNMRRARKATIYIYKWCKTAQIGGQSKDKDNGINKIILVQVYIIFALPDYSSEVIERHQNLFYGRLINLALEFDTH